MKWPAGFGDGDIVSREGRRRLHLCVDDEIRLLIGHTGLCNYTGGLVDLIQYDSDASLLTYLDYMLKVLLLSIKYSQI